MTFNVQHDQASQAGPPAAFADALRLGDPQTHGRLTIIPLAFRSDLGVRYETLATALLAGTFHVTEISEGGSVPTLKVVNEGSHGVLILDGEELVGAKQNRVLNTAVFVPGKSSIPVPVTCVEAGRWNYSAPAFHDEEYVAHKALRSAVHESVSRSLHRAAGHRSDQGRVWGQIAGLQQFAERPSATGAHRDVYRQRAADIAPYLEAFPLQHGQHGLLVLHERGVVGLDFVSRAACYAQLHAKLVRSYAFDAVTREMTRMRAETEVCRRSAVQKGGHGGASPRRDQALGFARSFLETIAELPACSFKSPGRGWDVRYGGDGISGSALTVGGVAVHGAFFSVEGDGVGSAYSASRRQATDRMAGFERRRAYRR